MNDLNLDARRWRFLDNPERYFNSKKNLAQHDRLELAPLRRQFRTAKEILARLKAGRGVLLADDVGLGKTTVAALVAWAIACQEGRVRIYAPNEVLRRRWAQELERHVPILNDLNATMRPIAMTRQIRQGNVKKLLPGHIQVSTHFALVRSHGANEQRTACDLMIIDEAHRAKGEGTAFKEALHGLGDQAQRKLVLTATPFSINLDELKDLLRFVGATDMQAIQAYSKELKRLFTLGTGNDISAESDRLMNAAREAVKELRPFLIRHGIDDLAHAERKHFGSIDQNPWEIPTVPATPEDLALLLRMDRILKLAPERRGERRNDPRFHTGWEHLAAELEKAAGRAEGYAVKHIELASMELESRRHVPHPKISAVICELQSILAGDEKVLVFCHHHATAAELLKELERSMSMPVGPNFGPPESIWRSAWEESLQKSADPLSKPIIDWLCTPGLRAQIADWIGTPGLSVRELKRQLRTTRPRTGSKKLPSILESADSLVNRLLDPQSTSSRAVLISLARGNRSPGGMTSHFPGLLDEGLRVMGAWKHDGPESPPRTLYTGESDLVLAIFNSPFGPDVLVTTDRLSEGVDLHRCCRHLVHYELDPSPIRTIQRNGRLRRVGSWAALTGQSIRYAYPAFKGTRDEKAVAVMSHRVGVFGLLLGGVPHLDVEDENSQQGFTEAVLRKAQMRLENFNRGLRV